MRKESSLAVMSRLDTVLQSGWKRLYADTNEKLSHDEESVDGAASRVFRGSRRASDRTQLVPDNNSSDSGGRAPRKRGAGVTQRTVAIIAALVIVAGAITAVVILFATGRPLLLQQRRFRQSWALHQASYRERL